VRIQTENSHCILLINLPMALLPSLSTNVDNSLDPAALGLRDVPLPVATPLRCCDEHSLLQLVSDVDSRVKRCVDEIYHAR